jgi:hypothetical protein
MSTATSRWLIEHLLQAEHTDRAMRSASHQMNRGQPPMHRVWPGLTLARPGSITLVRQSPRWHLPTRGAKKTRCSSVDRAPHLATAIAVAGIAAQGKRVRFHHHRSGHRVEKEKTARPDAWPYH